MLEKKLGLILISLHPLDGNIPTTITKASIIMSSYFLVHSWIFWLEIAVGDSTEQQSYY